LELNELMHNLLDRFRGKKDDTSEGDVKWWQLVEIKEIRLSHNCLSRLSNDCFSGLAAKVLMLDNNNLAEFPTAVWEMRDTLKRLICSHNRMENFSLDETVSSLVFLDLSHNQLLSLPDSMHFSIPSLTCLDIRDNQIDHLPSNLPPKLITLYAANNSLESLPGSVFSGTLL